MAPISVISRVIYHSIPKHPLDSRSKVQSSFRRFRVKDGVGRIHFVSVDGFPVFERRLLPDSVDVFGGSGHSLESAPEVGSDEVRIRPQNLARKTSGENLDRIQDEPRTDFHQRSVLFVDLERRKREKSYEGEKFGGGRGVRSKGEEVKRSWEEQELGGAGVRRR